MVGMIELFESRGIDITGEQHTKTKAALEFFARELQRRTAGSGRTQTGRSTHIPNAWTSDWRGCRLRKHGAARRAGHGTKR